MQLKSIMRGDVVIKLELKFGDSSVILSVDVQDLKDLKPEMKRFIEIIMEHLEPVLICFAESKLLHKPNVDLSGVPPDIGS